MTKIHEAFVQICLYGLLLSQPASGLVRRPFKGREFVLLLSRIPQLMPTDPASRASFYFAHQLGTCLLAVLVAGQAVAALAHHFILHDDVQPAAAPGMREAPQKQEFPIDRHPGRSAQKTTLIVAGSLALGTAAIATATVAFERGGADDHLESLTATIKAAATSFRPPAMHGSTTETG